MADFICCYKCTDRVVGCHMDCKKYLQKRKELDELNEKQHVEKQVRSTLTINSFNQCANTTREQRKLFRISCK